MGYLPVARWYRTTLLRRPGQIPSWIKKTAWRRQQQEWVGGKFRHPPVVGLSHALLRPKFDLLRQGLDKSARSTQIGTVKRIKAYSVVNSGFWRPRQPALGFTHPSCWGLRQPLNWGKNLGISNKISDSVDLCTCLYTATVSWRSSEAAPSYVQYEHYSEEGLYSLCSL
jgi:hypothetical protein